MRRFVLIRQAGITEGVELSDGRVFLFPAGDVVRFGSVDDAWDSSQDDGYEQMRYLDYHTTDEAYKLATE